MTLVSATSRPQQRIRPVGTPLARRPVVQPFESMTEVEKVNLGGGLYRTFSPIGTYRWEGRR